MRTRAGGVSRPTQGRFGGGKGARCLTRYARRRCDRGSPARAQQRAGRAPRPHGQGLAQLLSPSRWAEGAGGPHACSVLPWPRPPSGRQGQRPRDRAGAPLAGGPGGRGHREAWLMGGRVNPLSWPRRGCRALAVSGPGWARAQRVRLSTRTFCAERALPAPPAPVARPPPWTFSSVFLTVTVLMGLALERALASGSGGPHGGRSEPPAVCPGKQDGLRGGTWPGRHHGEESGAWH